MKKTTIRRTPPPGPNRTPVLRLSRETIRALGADDLSQALGGSCETTSWPTDKTVNETQHI